MLALLQELHQVTRGYSVAHYDWEDLDLEEGR